MIKIRVSYERPEQLAAVLQRLGNAVKSCRKSPAKPDSKHQRAYIILKE